MSVSSAALFRATKRKPDRLTKALPMDLPAAPKPRVRRADDFYPTGQPDAVRALLGADGALIRSCGAVWEPAVGAGDLAREIAAFGLPVIGYDIIDRGWPGTRITSFFDVHEAPARAIITNPPFNLISARDGHGRWLRHTLAIPGWSYCALLLSWDWPAARANGLGAILDQFPFSWCYLMRWKLDFTGEGSPPQRNAWFVWDRRDCRSRPGCGPHAEPSFRWLDKPTVATGQDDLPGVALI